MFIKTNRYNRQFGFLEIVTSLLPSVINVAGQLGSALITQKGQKEVAKSQLQASLIGSQIQERIAQLQLQAAQNISQSQPQSIPMSSTSLASLGVSNNLLIFGFITLGLIFLIKRR